MFVNFLSAPNLSSVRSHIGTFICVDALGGGSNAFDDESSDVSSAVNLFFLLRFAPN